MKDINIETQRCRVRFFAPEDLDDFMVYRNNLSWMKFQGFKGLTREEYAGELLGEKSVDSGVQLAIAHTAKQIVIGDIFLRRQGDWAWIGYTLNPLYTGKGYASEAVAGILGWLKSEGVREARASVESGNLASVNLLDRLKFSFEGTDDFGELMYRLQL